jgi:type II secretory pathway pseudopilin PulG
MIKLALLIVLGLLLLASPILLVGLIRYVRKRRAAAARQEIEAEMEWMERVLQKKADLVSPDDKKT